MQRLPSEPVVADIDHAVTLVAEIQRPLPRGVVSVEEEGADVRAQRMMCRLKNLVRQAVTKLRTATAGFSVGVIEVIANMDWIVVHAIAIEDYTAITRHPAEELRNVQMPDSHQAVAIDAAFLFISTGELIQIPFEDEDDRIR